MPRARSFPMQPTALNARRERRWLLPSKATTCARKSPCCGASPSAMPWIRLRCAVALLRRCWRATGIRSRAVEKNGNAETTGRCCAKPPQACPPQRATAKILQRIRRVDSHACRAVFEGLQTHGREWRELARLLVSRLVQSSGSKGEHARREVSRQGTSNRIFRWLSYGQRWFFVFLARAAGMPRFCMDCSRGRRASPAACAAAWQSRPEDFRVHPLAHPSAAKVRVSREGVASHGASRVYAGVACGKTSAFVAEFFYRDAGVASPQRLGA